ncbi:LysR family transcriptional regulator [Ursidibacter sp. B-7004-1]
MNKLDAIQYFCQSAQTLNFRETAERFAVSPSVVSRTIAELESQLGESLFKRNTRKMSLTSFGEQFLPKAKQWLNDADLLFKSQKEPLDEMCGVVRIATPKLHNQSQILQALLTALEPYPDLVIDWQTDNIKVDSIDHRIDMGVRVGTHPNPDFIIRPIAQRRHIFVASPAYLARYGTPQSIDDMARHFPMSTLHNLNTGRMWEVEIGDNQTVIPSKVNFISTDPMAELDAVLTGRTIAQLSDLVCRPYLERGKLVQLFQDNPSPVWQIYLYRPYQTITPKRVIKVFDLLEGILKAWV